MIANVNALGAHTAWMNQNASNIANINSEAYRAKTTHIEDGPQAVIGSSNQKVDLARELSEQIVIEGGFEAQTSSIKTYDEMIGTLLDMKG